MPMKAADKTFQMARMLLAWIIMVCGLFAAAQDTQTISLNFDQVDIRAVIKTIGELTGTNFVIDQKVSGNVTVVSPTSVPLSQAYRLLESILEVHGFAAIPTGNLVKIVPKSEAVKHRLPVRLGCDPNQIPMDDSLVTQIMPLRYARAWDVAQVVQALVSGDGKVVGYNKNNCLLVTDTSAKIHYIATVVSQLDVPEAADQARVFQLRYAQPQTLAELISKVMQRQQGQSSRGLSIEPELRILPDPRTNSIAVIGPPAELEVVSELVQRFDVPRPEGMEQLHVVYLKNATAKEVAQSLTAALSNLRITANEGKSVQVTADESTNSLIISANSQDLQAILKIVEMLDVVQEQILVEMLIVEVSQESLQSLGVDWATMDEPVGSGVRGFAATNLGPRVEFLSGDLEGLAVGLWRKGSSGVNIGSIVQALAKKSGVNILSTPHITTTNHHKARIIVGENRPFVENSRITETTDPVNPTVIKTYVYKDVGITLDITPHVSKAGMVRLEIDSEFTKLITDVTNPSIDTPTTAKRQAQTAVSMQSGSTMVIGGLIRDDKVTLDKRVPLLGDLPVFGTLFKYKSDKVQKTNLLIFIRPFVMETPEQMESMTSQKRQQMEQLNSQNKD